MFEQFNRRGLDLQPTSAILPADVDTRRQQARKIQARLGRRLTRIGTSLARHSSVFDWSRYLGWQTQQLVKLSYAASSSADLVVVIDSDVVVTRHADLTGLTVAGNEGNEVTPGQVIPCFERNTRRDKMGGKTAKWVATAEEIFPAQATALQSDGEELAGCYFDTPFILSPSAVRAMCQAIEERFGKPWWQAILDLPPRRWSEFALYKRFLGTAYGPGQIDWKSPDTVGYIFDLSDKTRLNNEFLELQNNQRCGFITIHSQANGRYPWPASEYKDNILGCLQTRACSGGG